MNSEPPQQDPPAPADRANAPAAATQPESPADPLMHEALQCLTAIRGYAVGARRALEAGTTDRIAYALDAIEQQIGRAHSLIARARSDSSDPAP